MSIPRTLSQLAAVASLAAPSIAQCPSWPIGSPDPDPGDLFGWDVDIDGDTAVVGAYADDEAAANAGAAYLLRFDGAAWRPTQKIFAPDAAFWDFFGSAVAIDGDTLLVSAPGKDLPGKSNAGRVYVFRDIAGTWTYEARLDPDAIEAGDELGKTSVDVQGDRALISSWQHGPFSQERGIAFVYRRGPTGWKRQATLESPDGTNSWRFGWALDLERELAAVTQTGPGYDGAVHLYRHSSGKWLYEQELVSAVSAPFQTLGRSVDLDGETLVAGAPFDATYADTGGSVVVFEPVGGAWSETQRLYPPDPSPWAYYGWRVALSGDRLVVSAWRDSQTNLDQGSAYLYHRRAGVWQLVTKFEDPEGGAGDEFGGNLDIDGPHLMVGAAFHGDAGRVSPYLLSTPLAYCAAKANSAGCASTLAAEGVPSLTSKLPFQVTATDVLGGQFGLLVVGTAAADDPFQGGRLCVDPAFARVAPQLSGGQAGGIDCSGLLRVDLNDLLCTGALPGVAAGDELFVQWWYRDPGDPTGFGLSDALRFHVCP